MPNNRRRLVGRVVSDKMDKTVTVLIEQRKRHRVYRKVMTTSRKIYAHDETNEIPVGALVRVVESKPLSRHKRWVVEAVLGIEEETEEAVDVELVEEEAEQ